MRDYLKKVIDAWKSHGFKVIFHADGNKWPILDDIISFGVDVIDPCESLSTMEVKKFRELYPDITVASPIDCQYLLAFGTKEEIRGKVRKYMKECASRGGFTITPNNIPADASVGNVLCFVDAIHEYGQYPRARVRS